MTRTQNAESERDADEEDELELLPEGAALRKEHALKGAGAPERAGDERRRRRA